MTTHAIVVHWLSVNHPSTPTEEAYPSYGTRDAPRLGMPAEAIVPAMKANNAVYVIDEVSNFITLRMEIFGQTALLLLA
jgi:hypothetical protein